MAALEALLRRLRERVEPEDLELIDDLAAVDPEAVDPEAVDPEASDPLSTPVVLEALENVLRRARGELQRLFQSDAVVTWSKGQGDAAGWTLLTAELGIDDEPVQVIVHVRPTDRDVEYVRLRAVGADTSLDLLAQPAAIAKLLWAEAWLLRHS